MSSFTEFKDYHRVPGTYKTYVSLGDFFWEIGKKGSGWKVCIRYGYEFDISVPRSLEWVQSPHDHQVLKAAAVHDILLEMGFDKAFASAEFRRAARALGCGVIKSWLLFFTTLYWTEFR